LDFNTGFTLRTASWFQNQPFLIVVAWKQSGTLPQSFGDLWDGDRNNSGSRAAIWNRRNDVSDHYVPSYPYDQGVTTAVNTAYKSLVLYDGTSSKSILNSNDTGTVDLGTNGLGTNGGIQLGGLSGSSTAGNAMICEAFMITYANHTAAAANAPTDITNAQLYLAAKWGL
jgi:hypothetical protein